MEPLTAASTFATLVGLIVNFRQERGAREQLSHRELMDWLGHHRHEELKHLIHNTADLQAEVDRLLQEDHATMIRRLEEISSIATGILARLDDIAPLARLFVTESPLSEQALHILTTLADSESAHFLYLKFSGGFRLQLEEGGRIEIEEPRFLEDDLSTLSLYGLLLHDYGSSGTDLYRITRPGARLVAALKKESGEPGATDNPDDAQRLREDH